MTMTEPTQETPQATPNLADVLLTKMAQLRREQEQRTAGLERRKAHHARAHDRLLPQVARLRQRAHRTGLSSHQASHEQAAHQKREHLHRYHQLDNLIGEAKYGSDPHPGSE